MVNASDSNHGPISELLWSLMLSTNDCYPGCGCDDDYFEQSRERVQRWCSSVSPDKTIAVRQQIETLLQASRIEVEPYEMQTNIAFGGEDELRKWLSIWLSLISEELSKLGIAIPIGD